MLLPRGVGFVVSGNLKNPRFPLRGLRLTISGFPDSLFKGRRGVLENSSWSLLSPYGFGHPEAVAVGRGRLNFFVSFREMIDHN
jgi:hypothetical protein